jgi:hypothetical protein
VPQVIAALCLLWALLPNPYGFYVLVRIIVCGVCGYLAYQYEGRQTASAWLFGLTAVVYNPIIPIYLPREIWMPIDLLMAVLLLWSANRDRRLRAPAKSDKWT